MAENRLSAFEVDLSGIHRDSKKSVYRVAKDTGLTVNTVTRYVKGSLTVDRLESAVVTLCDYYGVDWREPVRAVKKA